MALLTKFIVISHVIGLMVYVPVMSNELPDWEMEEEEEDGKSAGL